MIDPAGIWWQDRWTENWLYGTRGPEIRPRSFLFVRPGSCLLCSPHLAILSVRILILIDFPLAVWCNHSNNGFIFQMNEACGGMDNMCTVYDLNNRDGSGVAKIVRELSGYEGFLSCSRFIDDAKLITGSGDMALTMWDLNDGKVKQRINNQFKFLLVKAHTSCFFGRKNVECEESASKSAVNRGVGRGWNAEGLSRPHGLSTNLKAS